MPDAVKSFIGSVPLTLRRGKAKNSNEPLASANKARKTFAWILERLILIRKLPFIHVALFLLGYGGVLQ